MVCWLRIIFNGCMPPYFQLPALVSLVREKQQLYISLTCQYVASPLLRHAVVCVNRYCGSWSPENPLGMEPCPCIHVPALVTSARHSQGQSLALGVPENLETLLHAVGYAGERMNCQSYVQTKETSEMEL